MAKYQDVIIAGFGGQGVMLIGNLLAQAGMEHGLEVSFIPVYGAEMRGGTANCTVVLDEHPVGSPLVNTPRSIIVLNEPSLAKFQPRLHPDGVQIVNASLISEGLLDGKHRTVYIPVNDIAHELGNVKLANMVALGAWIKATGARAGSPQPRGQRPLRQADPGQRQGPAGRLRLRVTNRTGEGDPSARARAVPFPRTPIPPQRALPRPMARHQAGHGPF